MSDHATEHERWFEQVRSGAIEFDGQTVPREIADCAACRSRIADLEELAALLEKDADVERSILEDAARRGPGARSEVDAALTLAGATLGSARRRLQLRLALSAAACLLAFFVMRAYRTDPNVRPTDPSPPIVLGAEITVLKPLGAGADVTEFAWQYELGNGEWADLELEDATSRQQDRAPIVATLESGSTWQPDASTRDRFPSRFRWRVVVRNDAGEIAKSGWVDVSR